MTTDHLDDAYRAALAETVGVPAHVISAAWPSLKAVWGDYRKTVSLLRTTLAPFSWRWPNWEAQTAAERAEVLAERVEEWKSLTAADLLYQQGAPALRQLCRQEGIPVKAKTTKQVMVEALLAHWGAAGCASYVAREREDDLADLTRSDAGEAVSALVRYISARARNAERLEQLMEMADHLPYWEFTWGGETAWLHEYPKSCKRFNGKCLHHTQALKEFPLFTCASPECCCSIRARHRLR